MNIQIRKLTTLRTVFRSLVLLTIFGLCSCAPQGYYYNYPDRRSGYSYNNAAAASTQRRPQTTSRQSSSYGSSSNYLDAYSRRPQTTRRPPPVGYGSTANSYNSKYLTNGYSTKQAAPSRQSSSSNYQSPANAYTSRRQTSSSSESGKYRVSKADKENAKFAGVGNQEAEDESGKTLGHIKRKRLNRQRLNPCFGFGRDAAGGSVSTTPEPREQGRFLWDLNVYNVYPSSPVIQQSPLSFGGGCGGYGGGLGGGLGGFGGGLGGLGGGGLLSDPIAPAYGGGGGLNNFLGLFAPGILQNALAVTARPRPQFQADQTDDELNDLQSDPEVDPSYRPQQQAPVRRPNRVYYDSAGAAPITPAQLVGGVATTVNGLIQQLTGNIQPVYQSYRRSANYG